MRIRPTERIRCVKKEPSLPVQAQTYEAFKQILINAYNPLGHAEVNDVLSFS